jgi:drug/metabolite transporter (DMT)-like permease
MNLKATAPQIPTNLGALAEMGYLNFLVLLLRVGSISGLSLLLTWICYRNFSFLELVVAQSVIYIFAIAVSFFYFQESISWNKITAVFFILIGIACFYMPNLARTSNS